MTSPKRLIEVAFPLKQASLDSVHEKNVRHGHISTLHIWPARRPLAACRAALVATLLPDPGNDAERKQILERLAGHVVERPKKKRQADGRMVEELVEETEGGILHWGRESGPDLEWFRQKIRAAYGGRAPRVLDPFAGGGAIPLEAMRLGCEATAVDINPVAWFILKCTLEYPQKLAGKKRPLPGFVLQDREFMEAFLKAQGHKGKALALELEKLGFGKAMEQHLPGLETTGVSLEADLAWHVRAWGRWVLAQARRDLARFYPSYADFEPLVEVAHAVEHRPLTLVPLKSDGTPDVDALSAEFSPTYLNDKSNPRWVAKPTVAYLWARTVTCKNCGTLIPLLKTRWLAKKDNKRVLLTMTPLSPQGRAGQLAVQFDIQTGAEVKGHTPAERRAYDKQIAGGTMSRSGVHCPVCNQTTMTTQDIRLEGQAGRLGAVMTTVVVDGPKGQEFRIPTDDEMRLAKESENQLDKLYSQIPFGILREPTPSGGGSGAGRAFSVQNYGIMTWQEIYTNRQLFALGSILLNTRQILTIATNYAVEWRESIIAYLAISIDRLADRCSTICVWDQSYTKINHTFHRFALPITWDFVEVNPLSKTTGNYLSAVEWVNEYIEHAILAVSKSPAPTIKNRSVIQANKILEPKQFDLILTDPPYYDAIPYSDLMDFFYLWLRRSLFGLNENYNEIFKNPLSPKWNKEEQDGELIDDDSRHDGNRELSKNTYEDGMFKAFKNLEYLLADNGVVVIVFANKQPDAWETLVSALIRAGFVVTGSWPIATEMSTGLRNIGRASLASSVWLVCRKRSESARPGWDNRVLDEMRHNISARLRQFWDTGIRGPDFVWAATGPALEAYSQYPAVKKANQPGELLTVGEFLTHIRRMVVDFVVGRVLTTPGQPTSKSIILENEVDVSSLDAITTYYLLHRNDFGLKDVPAGPCILYAISCGLSDRDLADRFDLLARRGGKSDEENDDEEIEDGESEPREEGTGNVFRLKAWNQRKRHNMGYEPGEEQTLSRLPLFPDMSSVLESEGGYIIPLIDQVHRLMLLWRAGDVIRVDDYLERRALRYNKLYHQLLQALIELSPVGSEERSILESISNHVGGKAVNTQRLL